VESIGEEWEWQLGSWKGRRGRGGIGEKEWLMPKALIRTQLPN